MRKGVLKRTLKRRKGGDPGDPNNEEPGIQRIVPREANVQQPGSINHLLRAESRARINARLAELRAAPAAVAAPINIEPSILNQGGLYARISGNNYYIGQFDSTFRQRIATIANPFAIYGIGYFRQGGGGMISYVITSHSIYGIVSGPYANGLPNVQPPVHMYRFTNPLTPALRAIFESYASGLTFVFFHDNCPGAQTLMDFRNRFAALYSGIPGQSLVAEYQIGI
jgi:hypothetical protein